MDRKRGREPGEREVTSQPGDERAAKRIAEAESRSEPVASTVRREAFEVLDEVLKKVESGELRDE